MPPELGHSPDFEELSIEDVDYPRHRESSHDWKPVTDWAELFAHGADGEPSSRMTARAIMWRIVLELNHSRRQMLFTLGRGGRGFHVKLAVLADGSLRRAPVSQGGFVYSFGQEEARNAGHGSLVDPWVETAVEVSVSTIYEEVHIDFLSRDRRQPSNVVNTRYPEGNATRLLMCFALALGAHLLKRFRVDLERSRVTLSATDHGSGSLLEYYRDKYGLDLVGSRDQAHAEGSHRMAGPLLQALQRCDAVYSGLRH